jgi:hypothetical protein
MGGSGGGVRWIPASSVTLATAPVHSSAGGSATSEPLMTKDVSVQPPPSERDSTVKQSFGWPLGVSVVASMSSKK